MVYEVKLIQKVRSHVRGNRVGFLLGAGSSLSAGYPLAGDLWAEIAPLLDAEDRNQLAAIMVGRPCGLEQALDILDANPENPFPMRDVVAATIANIFERRTAGLTFHRPFVVGLSRLPMRRVHVFSLNYDPAIELACAAQHVPCFDGFWGGSTGWFWAASLQQHIGTPTTRRGRCTFGSLQGLVNLYKLHGSLGWFEINENCAVRVDHRITPEGVIKRLMVPPQRRKHNDVVYPPYSDLWSEFRACLMNDRSKLVHRLVSVGYGFRDEHVNAVIRPALDRANFTLVILAKELEDAVFEEWSRHRNVIICTESRCSLNGARGTTTAPIWSFEWLSREV